MDQEFTTLLRRFLRFAGDQELTLQSRLFDLGLDSMQALELLLEIEEVYGVELPQDRLVEATFETAGALWHTVTELRDSAVERAS